MATSALGADSSTAARVRRAAARVIPVLVVAGGIWFWSRQNAARCDAQLADWVASFSITSGEPGLPAATRVAHGLLEAPLAAALAAPGAGDGRSLRHGRGEETGAAWVSWIGSDGRLRRLDLRCGGEFMEVTGVAFDSSGDAAVPDIARESGPE